ncbi:hypothetical protein CRI93_01700 [Longimonas halophila]|uniref:Uncharacterized protein n=1 Tax=Longimonas halophila TaxID=1469170 RepID=A0A2H3NQJ9_9BACT|nr:hypothetical protein CRI93_01700 [Longimonas halophila]
MTVRKALYDAGWRASGDRNVAKRFHFLQKDVAIEPADVHIRNPALTEGCRAGFVSFRFRDLVRQTL